MGTIDKKLEHEAVQKLCAEHYTGYGVYDYIPFGESTPFIKESEPVKVDPYKVKIRASSAERAIKCSDFIKLSSNGTQYDNSVSSAASSGTRKHTIIEEVLIAIEELGIPKDEIVYQDEGARWYVEEVCKIMNDLREKGCAVQLLQEQSVTKKIFTGKFDALLLVTDTDGNESSIIIDFKTGNVPVYPDSTQMQLYSYMTGADKVIILQEGTKREKTLAKELVNGTVSQLTSNVERVINGNSDAVAGDHCRYCQFKSSCTAMHNIVDTALSHLDEPTSDKSIAFFTENKSLLNLLFCNTGSTGQDHDGARMEDVCIRESINLGGSAISGYALVRGWGNQKVTEKGREFLKSKGLMIYKPIPVTDLKNDEDLYEQIEPYLNKVNTTSSSWKVKNN